MAVPMTPERSWSFPAYVGEVDPTCGIVVMRVDDDDDVVPPTRHRVREVLTATWRAMRGAERAEEPDDEGSPVIL